MRFTFLGVATTTCLFAALVAGAARAQETQPSAASPRPTVWVQTITNGPNVTHSYQVENGSPHLDARFKELELAENEMNLAFDLSRLKQDYVQNERAMDKLRVDHFQYGVPPGYYAAGYHGAGYYASGTYGDLPAGDLLIKSRVAPQVAPLATYENGVKAIRTWEQANVDALKALREEETPEGKAAPEKVKPPRPAPTPKTQADPPRPVPANPIANASRLAMFDQGRAGTISTAASNAPPSNPAPGFTTLIVRSSDTPPEPADLPNSSLGDLGQIRAPSPQRVTSGDQAAAISSGIFDAMTTKPLMRVAPAGQQASLGSGANNVLSYLSVLATAAAICVGLGCALFRLA